MGLALIPPNPGGKPRLYSERDLLKLYLVAKGLEQYRDSQLVQQKLIEYLETI
jgi:hypothetical protein